MPSIAGLGPDGQLKVPRVTPEGSLAVTGDDREPLRLQQEQNRLLRKLIAGLELIHGQEFPEVD